MKAKFEFLKELKFKREICGQFERELKKCREWLFSRKILGSWFLDKLEKLTWVLWFVIPQVPKGEGDELAF